jgi:hypothetical protein
VPVSWTIEAEEDGHVQHRLFLNERTDLRPCPASARPCRAGAPSAEPGGGRASGAAGAALDQIRLNSAVAARHLDEQCSGNAGCPGSGTVTACLQRRFESLGQLPLSWREPVSSVSGCRRMPVVSAPFWHATGTTQCSIRDAQRSYRRCQVCPDSRLSTGGQVTEVVCAGKHRTSTIMPISVGSATYYPPDIHR